MNETTTESAILRGSSAGSYDNDLYETDMLIRYICYRYIAPVLCILGIFGNSVSLVVLTRKKLKESPYLYLRALAVVDVCALGVSFPYTVFSITSTEYVWKWYDVYIFIPLVNFFIASSIWITLTMTIERFVVVKFPLWARWRCKSFHTRLRILIILIFAFITCIPKFFIHVVVKKGEGYGIDNTPFREGDIYYGIDVFFIVTLHFVPLVILCLVNAYLVLEVQRATQIREELNIRNNQETQWQKDQRRFTLTLISIVLLSICFMVPSALSDILFYSKYHLTPYGASVSRIIRNVANVLLWCNLSMNFVLYCAFNKKFVRVLKDVFGKGFKRVRYSLRSSKTIDTTIV